VAVAGGAESMSNPPLLFRRAATRRVLDVVRARGVLQRAARALRMRPGDFLPDTPAVVEPSTGLSMGEHCEQMVKSWGIARAPQDALALRSHQRAHAASADQRLTREIRALDGLASDALVRTDTDAERLAALAPVFDRGSSGTITAGNSSPLTDGAAALLLMTEAAAERDGIEPLARVADWEFAAIAPEEGLLMAPAIAVPRLLARHRLRLEDLDIVEVHEAFAGQVLCNLAAWEAGWKEPAVGRVDPARLNALGGSIALGHPFAATGIRMLTTVAYQMQRSAARRALVSICGAGATAAALLLERP
jgi:acetyl-CoA acetyltransferase family protein